MKTIRTLVEFTNEVSDDDDLAHAERNARAIIADELQKAGIIPSAIQMGLFHASFCRVGYQDIESALKFLEVAQ